MDYILICTVSLLVAALTFFSGFGLGTLLLPAFTIFFPVEISVAATAIVHLLNNLFKLVLVGKNADKSILIKFGIAAAVFSVLGAISLNFLAEIKTSYIIDLFGIDIVLTPVKVLIGVLMIIFALFELLPKFKNLNFEKKYLVYGGALSGFFGGLSGHQGALRTAFLIRLKLPKEVLIGTMVATAVIIDISRISVYGLSFFQEHFIVASENYRLAGLVIAGTLSAFVGTLLGNKLLKKITIESIQLIVAVMLILLGVALIIGVV